METPEIENGLSAFTQSALTQAFAMIIVSEIGDKTFLIAAILAMRHPRAVVFAGAFGSLVVMSCLSAAMGHLLPTLIPRRWTQVAAAILFLVFGVKMLLEGRSMRAGNEQIQEELKEVEEELEVREAELDGTGARGQNGEAIPLEAMEEGGRAGNDNGDPVRNSRPKRTRLAKLNEGARNFFALLLGPVFVQAFILTFLGEWGDRSQIATIALAAAHVRTLACSRLTPHNDIAECLLGCLRHCGGTWVLYCCGCYRWTVVVYKNIR
jgi:Ca2+/H+ antiporter, TMEM165/GDT1 family